MVASATAAAVEADMKQSLPLFVSRRVWFSSLNIEVLLETFAPKFLGGPGGHLPPLDPRGSAFDLHDTILLTLIIIIHLNQSGHSLITGYTHQIF